MFLSRMSTSMGEPSRSCQGMRVFSVSTILEDLVFQDDQSTHQHDDRSYECGPLTRPVAEIEGS